MKKIIFILLLFLFAGCGKRDNVIKEEKPYTVDPVDERVIITYADNYDVKLFCTFDENVKLGGIVSRTEDILAIDNVGNRILRIGYDGEIKETIGNTGNGEGEFLEPTDIVIYEDKIYVLDSGNLRIQVMNQKFQVEKIISLQSLGTYSIGGRQDSIAILDENDIFLTTSFDNKIYLLKNQDELIVIEENFCGTCTAENGKVYFAQSMVMKDGYQAEVGKVFYAEYDEKEGLIKNQLPYFNTPWDLLVSDEKLYVLNGLYAAVERCDLNGDYNETIYKFLKSISDPRMDFTEFVRDIDGNFYVYDEYNNEIQKVYKVK